MEIEEIDVDKEGGEDLETNLLDNDDNIETNSDADSDEDQHERSVDDHKLSVEGITIDHFIDEELWDGIGKKLEDYDLNDMDMLQLRSLDDCINFYRTYAKVKGFGVRLGRTCKSKKDGHFISKEILCSKEGHRREEWLELQNRKRDPKPLTRTGCQAFILFKFHKEYKFWKVDKFHAEHNHVMVEPKQVSYIRSFRKITEADGSKIKSMRKAGISPCKMMRHFVNEAGSHENVDFAKKDLYNYVERIKCEEIKDGDAETVMAYLFGQKTGNPSFFVSYTRDKEGNLEKLFWCDGISRIDYKTFGHVLAFDTTYKCNRYNKPFVVLVGVNHHKNTVPFGCALAVNEKEDTYVWVLEQLIAAGDGFRPLTVITDGDKAMGNAIAEVLPEARHRLCLFHIIRNLKGYSKGKFLEGFIKCVKCRTPDDFENGWKELIDTNGFKDRKWAIELYGTKKKWAEAYMRGHFYAGMRSTQRCESMHRTLKGMLDKKVFLYDFIHHYHAELNGLRYEEGRQDYKTKHEQPVCDGILTVLKSNAAKIYTRKAFATLCSEMSYERYYLVKKDKTRDGGRQVFYWLQHVEKESLWYLVVNDTQHDTMYCCCMKLESVGFPCRHMFAVLKLLNAKELPRGCIMKRWTIYAKENHDLSNENERVEGNNVTVIQARFSNLVSLCMNICHQASNETFQVYKEVRDQFSNLSLKLQKTKVAPTKRSNNTKEYIGIGDPVVIQTGKGRPKRTKVEASSSVPTNVPCFRDDVTSTKEAAANSGKIDLNKSPEPSPNKGSEKGDNVSNFSTFVMEYMPNTYEGGDIYKESYCPELKKMEDDPSVFDWEPRQEW